MPYRTLGDIQVLEIDVNRIYSCLSGSFRLSRVTTIKFLSSLSFLQNYTPRRCRSVTTGLFLLIIVAFRSHESCNFNIGQFCREDLHPRSPIINLCQLSLYVPYRVISRKRISYYFSNQAELKIFNARRSKRPAGSTHVLFIA